MLFFATLAGCPAPSVGGPPPAVDPDRARFVACTVDVESRDEIDTVFQTWHRAYDGLGWLARYEPDYDLDGLPDSRELWTNDQRGNVLEDTVDVEADGRVDLRITSTFDEDGNPVREEWVDGDGVLMQVRTWESTGGLVRTSTQDDDADGEPDWTLSYTYDALDRRQDVTTRNPRGDVVAIERDTWVDDSDLVAGWEEDLPDHGGDLTRTYWQDWSYDDLDRPVHLDEHIQPDFQQVDYTYDGDQLEPSSTHEVQRDAYDAELGETDSAWTYDDARRILTFDGTFIPTGFQHDTYAWTCP